MKHPVYIVAMMIIQCTFFSKFSVLFFSNSNAKRGYYHALSSVRPSVRS